MFVDFARAFDDEYQDDDDDDEKFLFANFQQLGTKTRNEAKIKRKEKEKEKHIMKSLQTTTKSLIHLVCNTRERKKHAGRAYTNEMESIKKHFTLSIATRKCNVYIRLLTHNFLCATYQIILLGSLLMALYKCEIMCGKSGPKLRVGNIASNDSYRN